MDRTILTKLVEKGTSGMTLEELVKALRAAAKGLEEGIVAWQVIDGARVLVFTE